MKKGLTEIVFILDKSGSMQSIKTDAIGGFNAFLEEQKKVEGSANMTVILFDSYVHTLVDGKDIQEVEGLTEQTFVPSGMTALLDAIGVGIDNLSKRLSETEEDSKPENVIFAIMTDGHENVSEEYTHSIIKTKIENMQREKDWEFLFLGANIDAVGTARGLGIKDNLSMNFVADAKGVGDVYSAMGTTTTLFRSGTKLDENYVIGVDLSEKE